MRKLLATLRRDGLVEKVLVGGYIEYHLEKRFGARVDRKYGSETSGRVPLERLEVESPNLEDGVQYEPVTEIYLRRALRAMRIPPYTSRSWTSDRERVGRSSIAADYPFTRLVGVEFSPTLHRIAQRNVARFRARTGSAQRFELHLYDAASFDFPLEPVALHLYNPFGERVLDQVLGRLEESLEESPRRDRVLREPGPRVDAREGAVSPPDQGDVPVRRLRKLQDGLAPLPECDAPPRSHEARMTDPAAVYPYLPGGTERSSRSGRPFPGRTRSAPREARVRGSSPASSARAGCSPGSI